MAQIAFFCDNSTKSTPLELQQVQLSEEKKSHRVHSVRAGKVKRFHLPGRGGVRYEIRTTDGLMRFQFGIPFWASGVVVTGKSHESFKCRFVLANSASFALQLATTTVLDTLTMPLHVMRNRAQLNRPPVDFAAGEYRNLFAGNTFHLANVAIYSSFRQSWRNVLERINPSRSGIVRLVKRVITSAGSLLYSHPLNVIQTLLAVGIPWSMSDSGMHGLYSGLVFGLVAVSCRHVVAYGLQRVARAILPINWWDRGSGLVGVLMVSVGTAVVTLPLDTILRIRMVQGVTGSMRETALNIGRRLWETGHLYDGLQWYMALATVQPILRRLCDDTLIPSLLTINQIKD